MTTHGFDPDFRQLKHYADTLEASASPPPSYTMQLCINPTLKLFNLEWKHLWAKLINTLALEPEKGKEQVLVWQVPGSGHVKAKAVSDQDLLVMKMALEGLTSEQVARHGGTYIPAVDNAVVRALNSGLITGPPSGITRPFDNQSDGGDPVDHNPRVFTLQWHLTQACDLSCRHCYDRDPSDTLSLEQGLGVLRDFAGFCCKHGVYGQVTFTGGNPLLHPDFLKFYQAAADHGFTTSILGNPGGKAQLEQILAIQPPGFFQVSLEGLKTHNDFIRGAGHFDRALGFLDTLGDMGIYRMVMLTMTRDNMDQVIPLARLLKGRADTFSFNRLSPVGSGAALAPVSKDRYPGFLEQYLVQTIENPHMSLKENMFNILLDRDKRELAGGCTGYGCGAAFNFVSVLANGDVHACRKFPSYIGSLLEQRLEQIFQSDQSRQYRSGPRDCSGCRLRTKCRGCMAATYGAGLDIFMHKDPWCFYAD